MLDVIKLDKEKYRLGHTKVFFRAGILGYMEGVREERIGNVLAWLQAGARGKSARMHFKKLQDQKLALYCVQRSIRNHFIAKTWRWMQLWLFIKPNLKCLQFSKFQSEYKKKIALGEANIDQAVAECKAVTQQHDKLVAEKQEIDLALKSGGSAVQDIIDKTARMEEAARNDLKKQVNDLDTRIKTEEDLLRNIEQSGQKVASEAIRFREAIKELETTVEKCEEDKTTKDNQIRALKEEICHQEEIIDKLTKEKEMLVIPTKKLKKTFRL